MMPMSFSNSSMAATGAVDQASRFEGSNSLGGDIMFGNSSKTAIDSTMLLWIAAGVGVLWLLKSRKKTKKRK